ncbi:MAG: HAMP domain-containing sensor histidine kinase [Candidatus Omnitrophota bacterium]|nr:HAMP domain-containing sensor histidine kinase [Candidatus Omnitrophota bacterium]
MFFRSVRFKLILWYMVLLTVTLLAYSAVLYESFEKILIGHLDDLISARAEGLTNSISAYWQIVRNGNLEDGKSANQFRGSDKNSFLKFAEGWMEEKRKDPELMSVFVQIMSPSGKSLATSKAMPSIGPLDEEDMADVLNGEDDFYTASGQLADGKKVKFRIYFKPVLEDNKLVYIVRVAAPISLISLALKNLILALFILLPLTVILAGAPGVFLARLTLRPVDKMIGTLRQITAENLKLKIHMPDTRDEIKRLADTFNDMIERLDRSFSSQQRFIQDISQDLKVPMNMLKREVESVLARRCSDEEYRSFLTRATKEINGFRKTIDDLMVLSDPGNERTVLEIRKADLGRIVEKVLDDAKTAARQKGISVSFVRPEGLTLDCDEKQLKRLFANLLDNAVRYTYRGGRVDVSASKSDNFAVVAVTDTGIGIPEDEVDYIFDRFYQVSRIRASSSGFGLGLSESKEIAEAHKGKIAVESEQGKGSTFTVSLPLAYPG